MEAQECEIMFARSDTHLVNNSSNNRCKTHHVVVLFGALEHSTIDIWASLVAQLVKNLPAMRETWV